jgi:hypothetical protein
MRVRRPLATFTVLLALPFAAGAEEARAPDAKALQLRPKSMNLESPLALQRAPFVLQPAAPVLDLLPPPEDERMKASRSSCDREGQSLCYDSGSGKIVYKKTREYMPDLPGLRAEHISVKRDRITFKYTFQ